MRAAITMKRMDAAFEKLRVDEDGLVCPEVRRWAESKYRLVSLYERPKRQNDALSKVINR